MIVIAITNSEFLLVLIMNVVAQQLVSELLVRDGNGEHKVRWSL